MKSLTNILWVFIFLTNSSIAFADDGLDMQKFYKSVSEKYGSVVFAVNAYSKIQPKDSSSAAKFDKWYQNVGTALIFDDKGHAITLSCVLDNADDIKLASLDGKRIKASRILSKSSKIAVMKINDTIGSNTIDSDEVRDIKPGMDVLLFGIAKGDSFVLKPGVVSSQMPSDGAIIVNVDGDPGTSGSLVLDKNLNLLGLLAFQIEENSNPEVKPSASYVVIPIDYAMGIAHNIVNMVEKSNGWLGIGTSMAKANLKRNGVTVYKVFDNSPAYKSGIRLDDVIIEFNGAFIETPMQLIDALNETRVGDWVNLKIQRGKRIIPINVELDSIPDFEGQ